MKALLVRVVFDEALFRDHYTEVNPLSYPVMLPTSVAGTFGAMLGWDRKEAENKAKPFLFGAKLTKLTGINYELARIVQYKGGRLKLPLPIVKIELLVEPEFLMAMAGEEKKILEYKERLEDGITYLPYGGRNEYFVRDIEVIGERDVTYSKVVENYAPLNWVEEVKNIKTNEGWIRTHRVFHKIQEASEWFVFGYLCKLYLKKAISHVEGIGLYPLTDFYWTMKVRK